MRLSSCRDQSNGYKSGKEELFDKYYIDKLLRIRRLFVSGEIK